jgi:hypothetical protein
VALRVAIKLSEKSPQDCDQLKYCYLRLAYFQANVGQGLRMPVISSEKDIDELAKFSERLKEVIAEEDQLKNELTQFGLWE